MKRKTVEPENTDEKRVKQTIEAAIDGQRTLVYRSIDKAAEHGLDSTAIDIPLCDKILSELTEDGYQVERTKYITRIKWAFE